MEMMGMGMETKEPPHWELMTTGTNRVLMGARQDTKEYLPEETASVIKAAPKEESRENMNVQRQLSAGS
jgi:hypothetical protein